MLATQKRHFSRPESLVNVCYAVHCNTTYFATKTWLGITSICLTMTICYAKHQALFLLPLLNTNRKNLTVHLQI